MTGDFFQLPPVKKSKGERTFAFEADSWKDSITTSINLTQVFRQKDRRFIDMLNEMRFGRMSPSTIQEFRNLDREPECDDGIEVTEL